jgi:hypothetical protein
MTHYLPLYNGNPGDAVNLVIKEEDFLSPEFHYSHENHDEWTVHAYSITSML